MIIPFGWLAHLVALVFACVGLYIPVRYLWTGDNRPNTFGGYFAGLFVTALIEVLTFFLFMIFTLFVSIFHWPKYTENIYGNKVPIYSIGLNNSVEGHFRLGCGSVMVNQLTDTLQR